MSQVREVTDQTFQQEVISSTKPVIVDFWAPWCGPCRMMSPILDEVSASLGDAVKVVKLNTDQNPVTPGKYGIIGIPSLLIINEGSEVDRMVGVQQANVLKSRIQRLLDLDKVR